ncbi:MAG: DUF3253 domain-containing protein [Pseudomonadota bacterium]
MQIRDLTQARGPDKSICPSEVARAVAGKDEKQWRLLMKSIKSVAVELARAGVIQITRKGAPVDIDNFKGIYRLSLPKKPTDPD